MGLPKYRDIFAKQSGRTNEQLRRRAMLSGTWRDLLSSKIKEHFGDTRASAIGPVSKSKNAFLSLCNDISVLYTEEPRVRHAAEEDLGGLLGRFGYIGKAGLWPSMRKFQVMTIGIREMLLRVDAPEMGITYRPVYPDKVCAWSNPDDGGRPIKIIEKRERESYGGETQEFLDVLSIEDPNYPIYKVIHTDSDTDVSDYYLGGDRSGDNYPYRKGDGTPVLPYVLYHADYSHELWGCHEWEEVVDASLDLAVCQSFWLHVVYSASWPQRTIVGAHPLGTRTVGEGPGSYSRVEADPAIVLFFEATNQGTQPMIGQWAPGANILEMQQAISAFERSVISMVGIDAAHIVRDSGDAWSGAALSISRDGKREAQTVYSPQFRRADEQTVELTAILANRAYGERFPEDGYRVEYTSIPLSPQELASKREHNSGLIAAGRMSIVEAYIDEHPGAEKIEAIEALRRIAAENAQVKAFELDYGAAASDASYLNGAQISSLVEVVSAAASGLIPKESAVGIIMTAFALREDQASAILGSIGSGFKQSEEASNAV